MPIIKTPNVTSFKQDEINKMIACDGTIIVPELCNHSSSLDTLMHRFKWNENCHYYDIYHTIYDAKMNFCGVFAEHDDKNFKMYICDLGKDTRTYQEVVSHIENMIDQKDEKTKAFILKALQVHGHIKYNYQMTKFVNVRTEVRIFCNKHEIYFNQNSCSHIRGHGCRKCGKETINAKNAINIVSRRKPQKIIKK